MLIVTDKLRVPTTRHGKKTFLTLYRHYCNSCGADLGYKPKNYNRPGCKNCAQIGKSVSDITRQRMKISAHNRTAKINHPPFKGCRRPKWSYKKLVSPQQHKLRHNIRTRINHRLKSKNDKNGKNLELILGYSISDLVKHLESQFQSGMTWHNYGRCWHIDHVIPDSRFNYASVEDEDFKRSWSLSNLQPLWKKDNLSKSNKINYLCPRQ
jgi:hypothetical protein